MERDMKRDRERLAELVGRGGGMLAAGAFARRTLPDYIFLCEHLDAMVEAAITLIYGSNICPPGDCKITRDLADDPEQPTHKHCIQCIRDYLDQQAKEGVKSE